MKYISWCLIALIFSVCSQATALDCKTIANTLPYTLLSNSCICVGGYYWRPDGRLCQIDCTKVEFSTTIYASPTSCNCQVNYSWQSGSNRCVANTIINSPQVVIVTQPQLVSSSVAQSAIVNCSNVQNAVSNKDLFSCNCVFGFFWANGACFRNCSLIANSIGVLANTIDSCACVNGYIWIAQSSSCIIGQPINCFGVTGAQGPDPKDPRVCTCQANYYWNGVACSPIQVQPPIITGFNCSAIAYALPSGTFSPSCSCIVGFYWSTSACYRNCSLIPFTVGNSANNVTECTCISGYFWQGGFCKQQVVVIPPQNPPIIVSPPPVIIQRPMFGPFNPFIPRPPPRRINCWSIPFTNGNGSKPNTCRCIRGYDWNQRLERCVKEDNKRNNRNGRH